MLSHVAFHGYKIAAIQHFNFLFNISKTNDWGLLFIELLNQLSHA